MMEVVSGDNWSYKSCKAPVKPSLYPSLLFKFTVTVTEMTK